MGTEENKASARRFLEEVVNGGNVALVDELSAPGFVDRQAPPGVPPTVEGVKAFITMFRAAFPDLHYTLDDLIAEGDRVVTRATARGTMKGDFMGMTASGKTATWQEIHITRFEDGKAAEHWAVVDQLGMFVQLGFAQAPGQPPAASG
jgi:predicted ester cyclase